MIYHIKDNAGRGKATFILLCITLFFELQSILITPFYLSALEGSGDAELTLGLLSLVQGLGGLLNLVTGILFMTYLWRAYLNLSNAGYKKLHHSKGAIIWGWIVPIASLWVPHRTVKDIFRGIHSMHHLVKTGTLQPEVKKTPLLGIWWGFWIASSVFNFNGFKAELEYTASLALRDAIGSSFSIVAGICLLLLLRMMFRTESDTLHLILTNQAKIVPGMPEGPENIATGGAMPFGQTKFDEPPQPPQS